MCGIAGIFYFNELARTGEIKRMTESLRHRGPDDEGFLGINFESRKAYSLMGRESRAEGPRIEDFDRPVNLMLGHRRLSILDLSAAGHQPMGNEDLSLWIVHNGEIYNYLEIRKELERLGHTFRSKTDTEVILHAYEEWGTDCLSHFNGMWALALVDLKTKSVFCSRDRAGVKPFYYLHDGRRFCFASEPKALLKIDGMVAEPNEQILADYLLSGLRDHTQETFFKQIYQLRPGEYLLVKNDKILIQSYWDIETKEVRFKKESDYAERFFELLQDSIRLRLRSDVPIGTCLSGGLDSSSIVCLANRLMFDGHAIESQRAWERQKTFSSCFDDPAYDERKYIELVIRQTGAERNYVFPKIEALCGDLPDLIWHQDEPFGSTSIYAQWNVMKLAKERGVTVLLDGQGADELLAGYTPAFYHSFVQSLRKAHFIKLAKEIKAVKNTQAMNPSQFSRGMLGALLPPRARVMTLGMLKNGIEWANEDFRNHYLRPFTVPEKFQDGVNNYLYQAFRFVALPGLLQYEDRNSMAFSLEARLPFLDFRLVEYLFSLSSDQKITGGVSKAVFRNAMKGVLPEEIRNRNDKMGFATPEEIWFRTVLRRQIGEMIDSRSFAERGYFDVEKVKKAFGQHCEGKTNISFIIWRWVNLESWFRVFIDRRSSTQS